MGILQGSFLDICFSVDSRHLNPIAVHFLPNICLKQKFPSFRTHLFFRVGLGWGGFSDQGCGGGATVLCSEYYSLWFSELHFGCWSVPWSCHGSARGGGRWRMNTHFPRWEKSRRFFCFKTQKGRFFWVLFGDVKFQMMVMGWYVVDLISFGCWYFGLFHKNSRNMFGCSHRIILRQFENRHGFKSIACLCSFFWWGFSVFIQGKADFKINCQCELRFFKEQVEHGEIIQAGFLKGATTSLLIQVYQLWKWHMMDLMPSSPKKLSQTQQTHQPQKETFNLKLYLFLWNIST